MQDQKPMDYFKFDEGDLTANQLGQFSAKQKARLQSEGGSDKKWRIGIGVVLILLGLAGLIFFPDSLVVEIIWLLIWGGLGVAFLRSAFSKHQFKLAKVQGGINIVAEKGYGTAAKTETYHEMLIGKKKFEIDDDVTQVISQGDEYVIYYYYEDDEDSIYGVDNILSAELISKAK